MTNALIQIKPAETAALFSMGRGCRLKLWRKKRKQEPDFETDYSMADLNRAVKAHLLRRYESITRRALYPQTDDGDVLRFIFKDPQRTAPLILKPVSKESYLLTKRNGLSEDQIMELHAAMLATDSTWGSYAVGSRDSGELLTFDIDRDPDICARISEELPLFQAQVENGPAPDMLEPDDHRCHKCEYRVSCQGAALLSVEESTENDESLAPLIDEYQSRQQMVKDAKDLADETREQLELRMGARTQVFCGKKRVDWKVQVSMRYATGFLVERYERLRRSLRKAGVDPVVDDFIYSDYDPEQGAKFDEHYPPAETMKTPSVSRPLRILG